MTQLRYVYFSSDIWDYFISHFPLKPNQVPMKRIAINPTIDKTILIIELYPFLVTITFQFNSFETKSLLISKKCSNGNFILFIKII